VVACSSGPDSTCLLDILAKLKDKYNLELIVAHVNYGLRGKDSDLDQKLIEKYASRYKLKLVVFKPKYLTPALSLKKERGTKRLLSENKLRESRYEFFEKVRRGNRFDSIAVGHTLDDQAETYLMRIIRGSGLRGMAAMKHKNVYPVKSPQSGVGRAEFNRGTIIRPLLGITKKEILRYLKSNKLSYRTDKSNKEVLYLRNKIRNELIPLLENKYNPNIKETLYKSSLNIAEDYALIEELTEKYYRKHNELRVNNILKLHPALQKRIILKTIENVRPDLKDIVSAHIREVLKIFKSDKSKKQIVKFQGLKFTRIGDKLAISHS